MGRMKLSLLHKPFIIYFCKQTKFYFVKTEEPIIFDDLLDGIYRVFIMVCLQVELDLELKFIKKNNPIFNLQTFLCYINGQPNHTTDNFGSHPS